MTFHSDLVTSLAAAIYVAGCWQVAATAGEQNPVAAAMKTATIPCLSRASSSCLARRRYSPFAGADRHSFACSLGNADLTAGQLYACRRCSRSGAAGLSRLGNPPVASGRLAARIALRHTSIAAVASLGWPFCAWDSRPPN